LSNPEAETFNPYAAPLVGVETVDPFQQDDTRIRKQFIDCEANVRSIAGVLIFGGLILTGVFGIMSPLWVTTGDLQDLAFASFFAVLALLGIAQVIVGIRVQRLRPGARIGAILFCVLWMLFIPFGTIIGGACVWYLVRPAAGYVFTPEYREVIRKTPHVHFQTSAVSWGILITVLMGILALVALSFM
jgi:hypothetical protein